MPSRDGRRQPTPTSSSLTQLPKLNREALMGKTVELVRTRTPDLAAARRIEPEVLPSKKGTIEGFEAVTTKSTRESSMSYGANVTGKV